VENVLFDSNLVLSAGQSAMMQESDKFEWKNNVIAGSAANMMICGHGSASNYTWQRNTFALWASSLFALSGENYRLQGNIMVNNGGKVFYGIPGKGEFSSDENLWYISPGYKCALGSMISGDGKTVWFSSFEELQAKSGQEQNSVFKDPQFKNAPQYCTTLDSKSLSHCTRSKLILTQTSLFAVGDIVEVHFDGVARKVTAVEDGAIIIDPPLSEAPDRTMLVANWKDKTDFTLDFSSPFNDKYGSTINVPQYLRGDFDGDGRRDVPEWPQ